ncbi:hypothetical protein Nepgr_003428 [Nepenthes gracilis]|uniref:Uncharacterized protein n=1 Tax=Nepenthes gracilis TaxID=150966 RepID=A0AAD3XDJ9_NEPGR|nr:hypothetical protein Nepgr_003428 [Nepenthes gracilis]
MEKGRRVGKRDSGKASLSHCDDRWKRETQRIVMIHGAILGIVRKVKPSSSYLFILLPVFLKGCNIWVELSYCLSNMFGGGNSNYVLPVSLDENRFQYNTSTPNDQLQLFGNLTAGFKGADDLSRQQKLQISLNYNICQDEVDCSPSIPYQNPVSTGLRLSYDDDERNSSVTSAGGSITVAPSILLSLGDNARTELELQKEEFDQYIKIQEEHLAKGVRDMKQRHMASFLNTIEKGICKKLHEKELELESMNRKNRELIKRIKQGGN